MSSQITHTQSSTYTPQPIYLTSVQQLCHFYSLTQPHHVTASHPYPGENHQGGLKEHRAKQKWQHETHSVTYVPGLSTLFDLSRIDVQPPPLFFCCPKPPPHHPSSLTWVYLVPLSNYFCHQHPSGHTILIHCSHMSKPSQYSLICSTRYSLSIPALLRISSFLTLPIRDFSTSLKLLKNFISRTFTFILSALLIPHASAPYNAVGTITPSYSWPLSPVRYCSAHFSALPTLNTTHSFCVPHPFHIVHQLPLATPRYLKTIHIL